MLLTRIWGKRQRGNLIEADDMPHVLVWDIETIPDLKGFAAANGHDGKGERVIVRSTCVAMPSDGSQGAQPLLNDTPGKFCNAHNTASFLCRCQPAQTRREAVTGTFHKTLN